MKRRFVFLSVLVYFLIFFSSYIYSENLYEETENNTTQEITFEKIICLTLKTNDFRNLVSEDRLILVYLNKLLDYIVEKNRNLIGNREFCIFKDENPNSTIVGFSGSGNGLMEISINLALYLQYPNYTDADIAAILSHELAHDILNHHKKILEVINLIYDDYSKTSTNKKLKDDTDFENFYIKDPRYINTVRQQEIEADNLGFSIYLNSGFKMDNYKKHFIKTVVSFPLDIDTVSFSLQRANLFKELLSKAEDDTLSLNEKIDETISILLHKTKQAKKKSKRALDQLMSDIKYLDLDTSSHPTGFWRYLNINELEEKILKHKNINTADHDIIDTAYFKMDLTGSNILDKIQRFFNKDNYSNLPINYLNSKDPRVYIINELMSDYPKIKYSLELDPIDPKDIGTLKQDNTIILRANTVFTISIIVELINHIESNHSSCVSLFSEGLSNWIYYKKMLSTLKKDLNNRIRHLYI